MDIGSLFEGVHGEAYDRDKLKPILERIIDACPDKDRIQPGLNTVMEPDGTVNVLARLDPETEQWTRIGSFHRDELLAS